MLFFSRNIRSIPALMQNDHTVTLTKRQWSCVRPSKY
jgi:hypothetical protein